MRGETYEGGWNGRGGAPATYLTYDEAMSFCSRLTRRFAKELPEGYEIRLPTVLRKRREQIKRLRVRFIPHTSQKAIHQHAQRIPVTRRRRFSTAANFRSQIPVRPHHGLRPSRCSSDKRHRDRQFIPDAIVDNARNAEVGQDGMTFRIQQNVLKLDVPMDNPLRMNVLQALADVSKPLQGPCLGDFSRSSRRAMSTVPTSSLSTLG